MNSEYEHRHIPIENDVQDTSAEAWKKICEYVEIAAREKHSEFNPAEYIGSELYFQLHTLPASIAKLTHVKKLMLYGSSMKRIPVEIGKMTALEEFTPYTSYDLHWFPYEITECKNLKDSVVSTRALYGNFKHRRTFPSLLDNPVTYDSETISCSVCKKVIAQAETDQWWISLRVATDVLPLLANVCSHECKKALPKPTKGYLQYPHKGGKELGQPPKEDFGRVFSYKNNTTEEPQPKDNASLWKLIRKFWKK
ncbi:hypothetical protein [Kordia sp.]|uniref:hypothetical protein n=1 Tax=Kordia sp. TaxID=1965332 RepID=UPI003D6AD90C